jgi:N-acetylmuramoyl-L-alanine amidase
MFNKNVVCRVACWVCWGVICVMGVILPGCSGDGASTSVQPGSRVERHGDEIMVAGQLFRTGTPVVLWTDPGGYDAYRTEYRFEPMEKRAYDPEFRRLNGPQRYGLRAAGLSEGELEEVRGGGWSLEMLQERVDQFVLHYDACGTSQRCFDVLHDHRGLSVHFMLDLDGTIYQTLDVKERAWHAAQANDRSVGVEIANIGAYEPGDQTLDQWYEVVDGRARVTLPSEMGDGGIRTPDFVAYSMRPERVVGEIHGKQYEMHDLTAEQYDALIKLTATLCAIFPKMICDYPRDAQGRLVTTVLSDEQYRTFGGVVGHYHLSKGKIDPGPALQWDRVIEGAKALLGEEY